MKQRFRISGMAIATAKYKGKDVLTEIIRNSHPESTMFISCLDCHFDNTKLKMSRGLELWHRGFLFERVFPHTPHPPITIEMDTDDKVIFIAECPEYFYRYAYHQINMPSFKFWMDEGRTSDEYWKLKMSYTQMQPYRI